MGSSTILSRRTVVSVSTIAPMWQVEIGDQSILLLSQFEATASRLSPVATAVITVPVGSLQTVAPGDSVRIQQGYRGSRLWDVVAGSVRRIGQEGDNLVLRVGDPLAQVVGVRVSQGFTGATPQEILRILLSQVGVTAYLLTAKRLPPIPRFMAEGPLGHVMGSLAQAVGIQVDFYWLPGIGFWWGPPEESPRAAMRAPAIVFRENLLDHQVAPGGQSGHAVVQLAEYQHSALVEVEDPRFWSGRRTVRIDRVTYRARPAEVVVEWSSLGPN
jgi:hypothetical protein